MKVEVDAEEAVGSLEPFGHGRVDRWAEGVADRPNLLYLRLSELADWSSLGIIVGSHVQGNHALLRRNVAGPFNPLVIREARIAPSPIVSHVSQRMPLRSFDPARGGDELQRLVEFAGGVVFRSCPADDFNAGVEGDDSVRVAVFDGRCVTLGDGIVEVNVFVAPVEPPAGHFVAVAIRPLLNYLAPFVGEDRIDWLVSRALRQAERFLRSCVFIGNLTGQIEHQPNASRLQRLVQRQRQIAGSAPFAWRVAGPFLVHVVRGIEIARVLPQGQH